MDSPLPVIAVIGAELAPGLGLIAALAARGRFAARPLAWPLDGAAALAGVQGVWAGLADPTDPAELPRQAACLAALARDAGVRHLVWPTYEDTRRWMPLEDERWPCPGGCWRAPRFDARGASNLLFREQGVPATLLHLPLTWEELLLEGSAFGRAADGVLELVLPGGPRPLPGIAAGDIGACAAALFERAERWAGQSLGIAAAHGTAAALAAALSAGLGEPVRLREGGLDDPALRFQHEFNDEFRARRPVEATRALHPGLTGLDDWIARHAGALVRRRRRGSEASPCAR